MKYTNPIVIIFTAVMCLLALQTVLTVKADYDQRGERSAAAETYWLNHAKRVCQATWPEGGKHYDECLTKHNGS